jgi:hypothetical protein
MRIDARAANHQNRLRLLIAVMDGGDANRVESGSSAQTGGFLLTTWSF